jgi:hypothetical protein
MTQIECGALTLHQAELICDIADSVMHVPFIWGTVDAKLEICVLNESVDAFSTSVAMTVTHFRGVCFQSQSFQSSNSLQ